MAEMTKYTLGPWDYCKPHNRWLVYPVSARNDGIDYFIAEAINVDGREKEAKANARLIAAAPDMHAELVTTETWLNSLARGFDDTGMRDMAEAARTRAAHIRLTLSKATEGAS